MAANDKTTTPASTTVKVSSQSGAAKDDLITGISEDNSIQNLNVLANDPGSANIWSIDQSALNAAAGSQQPKVLTAATLPSGAKIAINADGTVRYEGAAALQSLAEGEIFTDSFIYTIRMANGALSTAKANVQIIGKNDVATFSGDSSGALTEDQASVVGKLNVSDIDHDQGAMQVASLAGTNGNLSINSAGNWTYGLTRDMNYLAAGQSASEQFIVKSVDGTEQAISVTVTGVNDVAVFSGIATGAVQEDGVLNAVGVLSVSDLDQGESAFTSTGNLTGAYGNFSFDLQSGAWTYSLRNGDANVQALTNDQSVQDKLTVSSVDGSTSDIVISITGQNEPVVVVENPAHKWNVSKQNVTKSGGGLDSQVAYDSSGVAKIVGFDSNDELHMIGAMNYDQPFIQTIDTDGDGNVDSTQLNFSYKDAGDTMHVDVILVGYVEFTTAQLHAPA